MASGKTPQKALGWTIDELSRNSKEGRQLLVQCATIKGCLGEAECDRVEINIPRQLTDLRVRATQFAKEVTRLRRTAATHLLVFMISHESRNQKPYALPIQCVPYKGLSEVAIRDLANKIIEEMVKRRMKVAGHYTATSTSTSHASACTIINSLFTGMGTNGEHNGLRMQGNTRPLHVLQVRAKVRANIGRKSANVLLAMLTPEGNMFMYVCIFILLQSLL